jgi:hypothetical protein
MDLFATCYCTTELTRDYRTALARLREFGFGSIHAQGASEYFTLHSFPSGISKDILTSRSSVSESHTTTADPVRSNCSSSRQLIAGTAGRWTTSS